MPHLRDLFRGDEVHASVYTSPEIFRLEMQRLFGRSWLLAGHQSQLPAVGDHLLGHIGDQPILLVRESPGSDGIRAFHNRCPHRGARLKTAHTGNASAIVCPYHGWSFRLDGSLRFVPAAEEYAADPCRTRGLDPVAGVSLYRGFIFVNAAPRAGQPLEQFLGPMRAVLDDLVDRAPGDDLQVAPALLRHRYRGNWKLTFENLNDTIHAGVAHAAAARVASDLLEREPAAATDPMLGLMAANGKPVRYFQQLRMTTAAGGHSFFDAHMPTAYDEATHRAYLATLERARGPAQARRILDTRRHLGLLYPGSTWHARYQTVRIVQPLAPDLTEVITMCLRLKGAPPETFKGALGYCNGASSALSSVITDDLEIYEGIQRSLAGADAWISLARGWRGAGAEVEAGGSVPATSEGYIRGQYRAWLAMLEEA